MSRTTQQLDPRGPRFTAGVTLVLFAAVLTAPSTTATVLVAIQTVFFTIGAGLGVQYTPTAYVFRSLIRPRLAAPSHLEDPQPPRFAQAVGLLFSLTALVSLVAGATLVGQIAAGFALAAAFLNSVFGYCLGCELYLLIKRLSARSTNHPATTHDSTNPQANKEEVTA
ncbi:MAG: hypothetical protein JWR52_2290 [Marmoricola sp.]|nr:hypothetical protein [Marmoricola sp.]